MKSISRKFRVEPYWISRRAFARLASEMASMLGKAPGRDVSKLATPEKRLPPLCPLALAAGIVGANGWHPLPDTTGEGLL